MALEGREEGMFAPDGGQRVDKTQMWADKAGSREAGMQAIQIIGQLKEVAKAQTSGGPGQSWWIQWGNRDVGNTWWGLSERVGTA